MDQRGPLLPAVLRATHGRSGLRRPGRLTGKESSLGPLNRFKYVLTPKHGSWLNIVETLFGKMTRTFLRNIRVQSWEELRDRILKGIAEINADPIVHRWKKFEALAVD